MDSMESMEDAVKQLQEQVGPGMYVVNQEDDGEGVYAEYAAEVRACDALCEAMDPAETPYKSKYEARDRLNHLCNKLEANKTVASLEKKKGVLKQLNWRIAALQVRLGSIAWDVEEPHNCQAELDRAVEFYFPGVKDRIEELAGPEDTEGDQPAPVSDIASLSPPPVHLPEATQCPSGLKCLNMMGILWAGRGHSRRSFMYLLASKSLYDQTAELANLGEKDAAEIESIFTHNLFYLAQAYGNHGDVAQSSYYCHMTLQRQLDAGLADQEAALDWCKNCMGIADFYLALQKYKKCGVALAATEVVLLKFFHQYPEAGNCDAPPPAPEGAASLVSAVAAAVTPRAPPSGPRTDAPSKPLHAFPLLPGLLEPGAIDLKTRVQEIEADFNRRWARLDESILRAAYDRESEAAMRAADGLPPAPLHADSAGPDDSSFFSNLPYPPRALPELDPSKVRTFEEAREVFLRAAGKVEVAKRDFPMDGCVSDHCNLLEEHSRLYHHLSVFERELKRKMAMLNKRLELLRPVVLTLNRNAFDALHKQVSYELGEIYISLGDLLSEKYAGGAPMKRADAVKSNDHCLGGISMFAHFTNMYEKRAGKGPAAENYSPIGFDSASSAGCMDPDESLLNEDELRPFLNAHFHMARLISKITVPAELPPPQRVQFLVAALKRYEWLVKAAPKYCALKEVPVDSVFGEELGLCREMAELLPTRINRVLYLGASS